MASNTTLNAGSAGDVIATKERTHDGDAAKVQVVTLAGVTGTEGSYTFGDIGGDAANGLDVDVTRLPALPVGTNNIGDVDVLTLPALPAGTNNIGDVDVLTVPADPFGANADAASASGSISAKLREIATNGVRVKDGAGNALTSKVAGAERALSIAIVDGAGNQVTSFGGSGGTSATDDAAFTPASGSGTPMMGFADETTPDAVDEGDVGVVRMTLQRGLHTNLRDASGTEIGTAAAPVRVDPTGTTTQPVSLAAAVPAGTNNIGDVDVLTLPALPAGTNNIGDVDVLSVVPGTGATALGKAVDSAAGGTDTGVALLAVRDDSLATLTPADGDYVPLRVDSTGALHVRMSAGGVAGHADDAAFTPGTTEGVILMAHADETTPDAVDEGDAGAVRMTLQRGLHTNLRNASGTEIGTSGAPVRTDPTGTTTQPVSLAAAVPAGTNNIGDVDVLSVPADPFGANADAASATGSISAKLRFIAATGIPVTALPALPAGTNNIGDVDVATLPNVTLAAGTNTNEVVGDAAHGAAAAGNPLLQGLEGRSTAPTAVDDGDVVRALATLLGKQVVVPYALPANSESYASPAAVADTNDDEAFAAGAAGVRHYITGVQVFNGHDTVGTEVVIKDGTTVLWRGWAEQAGGGCSARFDPPLRGTAATAVNVANITTGSATYFNLQGYQAIE